jgi:hypothetical protein
MASIAVVAVLLVLLWYIVSIVRGRRGGIVAKRGLSIGADLAALAETPKVHVTAVTTEGPDRVRLVVSSESGPDREFLVFLRQDEFGFEQLREWQREQTAVAIVTPPDSRILHLRSTVDLQPLTLSRVERT